MIVVHALLKLFALAVSELGRIKIPFGNAQIELRVRVVHRQAYEPWDRVLERKREHRCGGPNAANLAQQDETAQREGLAELLV